jgi:hypothetical protein
MIFELTKEDTEKIKKFHPKHKKQYNGAIGGGEEYSFIPTGLGMIKKYKCKCGAILDLTEYELW